MAIKSQLRLQQVTGSVVDLKPAAVAKGQVVAAVGGEQDLRGVLKYMAQAITNINGLTEFGSQSPGTFTAARLSVTGSSLAFNQAAEIEAAVGALTLDGTTGINLQEAGTTVLSIDTNKHVDIQNAVDGDWDFSGNLLVDAAVLDFNATDDSEILVSTAAKDLKIGVTGGGGQSLELESAGTGANAIAIAASNGGVDIQAALGSEIGLADGLLTLDLNGTDAVDGLLVDSEGTITLQANRADTGAIIINAENANALMQLQNAGTAKLVVSASQVSIHDQARVQDSTQATALGTGALVVDGGASIGDDLFIGDDLSLKSDGAVFAMGDGDDVTLTHDGSNGATLSSAGKLDGVFGAASRIRTSAGNFTLDSAATLVLSGATVDIDAEVGALNLDGDAGINIGTQLDAPIDIDSTTFDLDASGIVSIDAGANAINIGGNAAESGAINIGTSTGARTIKLGNAVNNTAEVELNAVTVDVNWGAAGGVFAGAGPAVLDSTSSATILSGAAGVALSGSGGVCFSDDTGMTSAGAGFVSGMKFANYSEFADFRGKSLFSASTTVIGAFNALADGIQDAVTAVEVMTGSATKLQLKNLSDTMPAGKGYVTSINTNNCSPSNTEVFVNGQLLMSGSSAAGAGGDYGIVYAAAGSASINFQFGLVADDVVLIKTTAAQ